MRIIATGIPDVKLIEPVVHGDRRGFFMETYNRRIYTEAGIPVEFVQDNYTRSGRNVLRGLHYQIRRPQAKLVRVLAGEILDVAVDLRRSSHSFGRWTSYVLSAENRHSAWIPQGFAHGFLVRSETAEVMYKITDYYSPADELAILWRDGDLAIDWQLSGEPVLSDRDSRAGSFAAAEVFP
jgi:dTDP-4-dehydrorhamnose 3,5-epimerase